MNMYTRIISFIHFRVSLVMYVFSYIYIYIYICMNMYSLDTSFWFSFICSSYTHPLFDVTGARAPVTLRSSQRTKVVAGAHINNWR